VNIGIIGAGMIGETLARRLVHVATISINFSGGRDDLNRLPTTRRSTAASRAAECVGYGMSKRDSHSLQPS
jgi:predicted dinucleotide-binding enzyme